MFKFKSRITAQLASGFIFITLLAVMLTGIVFMQLFKDYAYESKESLMRSRARTIAATMSQYVGSADTARGYGMFMRFLQTFTEASVWITDKQGTVTQLSEGTSSKAISSLPKEAQAVIQSVLSGQEAVSESFDSLFNEAMLTVGVPMKDADGSVIGAVLLHAPITGITDSLARASNILLISLAIAMILSGALAVLYALRFTKPLKAMNAVALDMANGNYSARTELQRNDELGQLGNSLNMLSIKLDHTIGQLKQEKGKLSDIITSISEGIAAFDGDGRLLSHNPVLPGLLNLPDDIDADDLTTHLREAGVFAVVSEVLNTATGKSITQKYENKVLKSTVSPILNQAGKAAGCVALVQDISESEKMEQLRRQFVSNVSHEFRTPLTVIQGSLEALVDHTIDETEDVQRYHEKMLTETKTLEKLVQDLLDLSRMEAGVLQMSLVPVDISQLLADVARSMQILADKKQIELKTDISTPLPSVTADYIRLRQVLVIILDNAIKFAPGHGFVEITARAEDGLYIRIHDNGPGFAGQDLAKIWDRFYTTDPLAARNSTGTGLGLAIAKQIIDLHGGMIQASNCADSGACFEINLPLAGSSM
jgi:signal transduction histidine kinase